MSGATIRNALPESHSRRGAVEAAVRAALPEAPEDRRLMVTIGDTSDPSPDGEPVRLTVVFGNRVIAVTIAAAEDAPRIALTLRSLIERR